MITFEHSCASNEIKYIHIKIKRFYPSIHPSIQQSIYTHKYTYTWRYIYKYMQTYTDMCVCARKYRDILAHWWTDR